MIHMPCVLMRFLVNGNIHSWLPVVIPVLQTSLRSNSLNIIGNQSLLDMAQKFAEQKITASNGKDADEQNQLVLSLSHGLPPEILSKIFVLAIPTQRNFEVDTSFPTEKSDYTIKFALSQTCKYGRAVALATPHIWSSIFVLRRSRVISIRLVAFTRMFIVRSKSTPLHITINAQNEGWERGNFSTLFDLIFSQAYRWKSAMIRFEGVSHWETFPRLDLPILDSLYYRYDRCVHPEEVPNHPGPNFGDTPSLRYAIVAGYLNQIPLPWSQILHYDGCPGQLEVMRPARNQLRTCILHSGLGFSIHPPLSPIVFTKLTSLKIINTRSFFPPLLEWIVTPVLESLEIYSRRSKTDAPCVVADLHGITLTNISTTLRSLSFHAGGMTEQALETLLYSTPCLTTLDICDTPASVFACLGAQSSVPLVPRLETLTIHNFSHSDAAALLTVYDTRYPPLNTVQDDMGIAHLNIILSYRSFRACFHAQCRIAEEDGLDIKALRLRKILWWWCNHLVIQFLPEKKKKYGVRRRDYHRSLISPVYSLFYRCLATKFPDAW